MSTNLIKFKKDLPEMKIIEKFSPDVTVFETKEDFIEYFDKNKDELNKLTTQKLNKMFNINGYKITKLLGEVSLKKVQESKSHNSEIEEIQNKLQTLEKAFANLLETLTNSGLIKNL